MEENKKRKAVSNLSKNNVVGAKAVKITKKASTFDDSFDEFDDERGRTPSGSDLTGVVKDLRYFFSPNNQQKKVHENDIINTSDSQSDQSTVKISLTQTTRKLNSSMSAEVKDNQNNNMILPCSECKQQGACGCKPQHANQIEEQISTMSDEESFLTPRAVESAGEEEMTEDQETAFLHHLAGKLKTVTSQEIEQKMKESRRLFEKRRCEMAKNINGSSKQQTITQLFDKENTGNSEAKMVSSYEDNTQPNPKTMSISSVFEMLKKLKEEISQDRQKDNQQVTKQIADEFVRLKSDLSQEVQQNVTEAIKENTTVMNIDADLQFWKLKTDTLIDVCSRMHTEICDLTTRLENVEISNSKRMLLITGLKLVQDSKKKETLLFLNDFLNTYMGLRIVIDDFFTLGIIEPRPIVIVLQTIENKRQILQAKQMLNSSPETKGIYINEYLPLGPNEKRKKDKDLAQLAREQGRQVSYIKGTIALNGVPYFKPILPPTPKELIDVSPEQLDAVLKMKTIRGEEMERSNSTFLAYAAKIDTLEEVAQVYKKIKIIKPEARHVVCAFWANQTDTPPQYLKDFQDDGEPGAGRVLLDILEAKGLRGTAIFVTRKYGGVRMGADRFTMYARAAKSALGIDVDEVIQGKKRQTFPNKGPVNFRPRGGHQQIRAQQPTTMRQPIRQPGPRYNNPRTQQPAYMQQMQTFMQPVRQAVPNTSAVTQHLFSQRVADVHSQVPPRNVSPPFIPPNAGPGPASNSGFSANMQNYYQNFPLISPNSQYLQAISRMQTPIQQYNSVTQMKPQSENPKVPDNQSTPSSDGKMEFTFSMPDKTPLNEEKNTEEWEDDKDGQWADTEVKQVD